MLAAGARTLRCARCGTAFRAESPAPLPPPAAPPAAPTAAPAWREAAEEVPRPVPARGPRRHAPIDPPLPPTQPEAPGRGAALAAWIASLLLLAGAAWAAHAWRAEIVAAWPPAARLYAALGIG